MKVVVHEGGHLTVFPFFDSPQLCVQFIPFCHKVCVFRGSLKRMLAISAGILDRCTNGMLIETGH